MPPDVRILQPVREHLDAIIGLLAAEGWSDAEDSQRTWRALTAPGSTALVALTGEEMSASLRSSATERSKPS